MTGGSKGGDKDALKPQSADGPNVKGFTQGPVKRGHIACVDPAVKRPNLESFSLLSRSSQCPLSYHLPGLYGMASLFCEPEPTGLIILGSASSVHDGLPWQRELMDYVKAAISREIPILGICFGHQLLAFIEGARIGLVFEGEKKRGLRKIVVEDREKGVLREGNVVVSHQEGVLDIPSGWRKLAWSEELPIEALAHMTKPIWSYQCHPEACETFLEEYGISLKPSDLTFGHQMCQDFLDYCAEVSKT